MIEILCSDGTQQVRLERFADAPARVHVGTNHGLDAILAAIGHELTEAEAIICRRLWSDDDSRRRHTQTPEGTLFTLDE